jgi:anti-sigma factor RsiW
VTCRELIDLLNDYLEGELPGGARGDLERHLQDCAPCRAYLATYRKTRALGAAAFPPEMPHEMTARLREFLIARLRA